MTSRLLAAVTVGAFLGVAACDTGTEDSDTLDGSEPPPFSLCRDPGAQFAWSVTADGTTFGPGIGEPEPGGTDDPPISIEVTGEVGDAPTGTLVVVDDQTEPPTEIRVALADGGGPIDLRLAASTQVRLQLQAQNPAHWPGVSPGWVLALRVEGAGDDGALGLLLFAGDIQPWTEIALDTSPIAVARDDDSWCELPRPQKAHGEFQSSLLVSTVAFPDEQHTLAEGQSIVVDDDAGSAPFEVTAFNTSATHEGVSPLDVLVRRAAP